MKQVTYTRLHTMEPDKQQTYHAINSVFETVIYYDSVHRVADKDKSIDAAIRLLTKLKTWPEFSSNANARRGTTSAARTRAKYRTIQAN